MSTEETNSKIHPTTLDDVVKNKLLYLEGIRGIDQMAPLAKPDKASDSEARINYQWCALVAFNMRLADTTIEYKDEMFLDKAKGVLNRNPKLGCYVAYLWATDSVEMEEEFDIKITPASNEMRSFMADKLADGINIYFADDAIEIGILNDIFQRGLEYSNLTDKVSGQFNIGNLRTIASQYESVRGKLKSVGPEETKLREIIKELALVKE
jgi:hypothetical protein